MLPARVHRQGYYFATCGNNALQVLCVFLNIVANWNLCAFLWPTLIIRPLERYCCGWNEFNRFNTVLWQGLGSDQRVRLHYLLSISSLHLPRKCKLFTKQWHYLHKNFMPTPCIGKLCIATIIVYTVFHTKGTTLFSTLFSHFLIDF